MEECNLKLLLLICHIVNCESSKDELVLQWLQEWYNMFKEKDVV